MKVRRKQAKAYNGEPMPWRMAEHMRANPGFKLPTSPAVFPICEAAQWPGHDIPGNTKEETALLRKVQKIPHDHPHAHGLRARGIEPSTRGHLVNSAGHLVIVEPGELVVNYPDGLVHHAVQNLPKQYDVVSL